MRFEIPCAMDTTRWLLSASLIFFLTFSVHAQEREREHNKSSLGITFSSFGDNELVRLNDAVGFPGTTGKKFYTLGLNYLLPLNRTFDLETGLEYSYHKIMVDPNLPPSLDQPDYPIRMHIMTVPVAARLNFLKYLFFSAGGMLNLDLSNPGEADTQTGLGAIASLGVQYDFDFGMSIFINPYIKANGLLPFAPDDHQQRLMVSGWRFGVLYQLTDE